MRLPVLVLLVHVLQVVQSVPGVQAFRAGEGAHADLVAFSQLGVSADLLEALVGELVSGVDNPPVGLHQDGGAEVLLGMPPVGGAGGGAAGTQHALVEPVQVLSLLFRLDVLSLTLRFLCFPLQVGLDVFVLRVEVGHVHNQVFQHEHEHERRNHRFLVVSSGDRADAGEVVSAVDVHGARTADSLSAGSSEGESGVNFILDLDQGVQEHGAALFSVNVVGHELRDVVWVGRVRPVNVESLHVCLFVFRKALVELNDYISLQYVFNV